MTGHERDLLDRETCFEEAASTLVSQVMKMQIIDLQLIAGSRESRAHRAVVIRKYATPTSRDDGLLELDLPRIEAR